VHVPVLTIGGQKGKYNKSHHETLPSEAAQAAFLMASALRLFQFMNTWTTQNHSTGELLMEDFLAESKRTTTCQIELLAPTSDSNARELVFLYKRSPGSSAPGTPTTAAAGQKRSAVRQLF
jgi:hypothetical protein